MSFIIILLFLLDSRSEEDQNNHTQHRERCVEETSGGPPIISKVRQEEGGGGGGVVVDEMDDIEVAEAASGKRYALACEPETRLSSVQTALERLTGVRVADQILISGGAKLDPARTLDSYALAGEGVLAEERRQSAFSGQSSGSSGGTGAIGDAYGSGSGSGSSSVRASESRMMPRPRLFLFNRASLRGDSPPRNDEPLPAVVSADAAIAAAAEAAAAAAGGNGGASHPLEKCPTVLLRNLPTYEREFRQHLVAGQALWDASQQRHALALRLIDEMTVQALALEEARANVEVHYRHVSAAHAQFMREFHFHRHVAGTLLAAVPTTIDAAVGFELDPALVKDGRRSLGDCVDVERIRSAASSCGEVHEMFTAEVDGLAHTYRALQVNVEELYMSTPPVDIKDMESRFVNSSSQLVEDEASLLQSLSQDLSKVQAIVEDTVARMGGGTAAAASSVESAGIVCEALEKMNSAHVDAHLPRIEECDGQLHALCLGLAASKDSMTRCVHEQLRSVSSLQSRIRDLKSRHGVFRETMAAHASQFAELKTVRYACTAYESCMAELVRRQGFCLSHAARAEQAAEALAAARHQEMERRARFEKEHGRFLPQDLWDDMGMCVPPPRCDVNISDPRFGTESTDGSSSAMMMEPLHVTLEDVKRIHTALSNNIAPDLGSDSSNTLDNRAQASDTTVDVEADGFATEPSDVENCRLRAEVAVGLATIAVLHAQVQSLKPTNATAGNSKKSTSATSALEAAVRTQDELCQTLRKEVASRDDIIEELQERCRTLERIAAATDERAQIASVDADECDFSRVAL